MLKMARQTAQSPPAPPSEGHATGGGGAADHDPGASLGPRPAAARCTLFEHALCGATDRPPQRDSPGAELQRNYQTPRSSAHHLYDRCRAASAGYRSNPALALPVEDLRALPEAEREATAQRLIRAEALYPFDLENGPLLQVRLLRLGEQEHILLLTMHHIISDGWSMGCAAA